MRELTLRPIRGLIYRRLLKYAKPYTGMFSDRRFSGQYYSRRPTPPLVYLVKTFLNGAFVNPNPKIVWEVPIGVVLLFTLRGIGDYVQNLFPQLGSAGRSSRV